MGLLARERASGRLVGVVNINEIVAGAFSAPISAITACPEFRGSGMMGEALRATVELAFGELGLHRLEANVQPANTASLALLRRAGFRKEGFSPRYLRIDGQWRDHERWALLADDAAPAGAEGLAGGDGQA